MLDKWERVAIDEANGLVEGDGGGQSTNAHLGFARQAAARCVEPSRCAV
jgi:hypothetical protein